MTLPILYFPTSVSHLNCRALQTLVLKSETKMVWTFLKTHFTLEGLFLNLGANLCSNKLILSYVLRKISNYEHKEIAQPNTEGILKNLKFWSIGTYIPGVDGLICMVMVQSSHKLSSKSYTSIIASHKFWWPLHSLDSQTCKDHVPEITTWSECVTVTHKNRSSWTKRCKRLYSVV
jgi:hypothetical protein